MWTVLLEQADYRDRVTGDVVAGGAWRVRVKGSHPKPAQRVFFGEVAWADAARYARDAAQQIRST